MELFLNLCWLGLLWPAYLLWRRRVSSQPLTRASFIIICTLGCALVLLFPVISASDDLHAAGQPIEESERTFRHGGHCASLHSLNHISQAPPPASASLPCVFEQVSTVVPASLRSQRSPVVSVLSGRAPPRYALSL